MTEKKKTPEEILAEQIEEQRKKQEAKEQEAIQDLIGKEIDNRFQEIVQCLRCGKQKPHDNFPMCDICMKIVANQLQNENKDFIEGKYYAAMNQVEENVEEDEFTNLMSNIDKFIK